MPARSSSRSARLLGVAVVALFILALEAIDHMAPQLTQAAHGSGHHRPGGRR